ncbi:hypothetical protein D3C72_2109850 [compost metagenome]
MLFELGSHAVKPAIDVVVQDLHQVIAFTLNREWCNRELADYGQSQQVRRDFFRRHEVQCRSDVVRGFFEIRTNVHVQAGEGRDLVELAVHDQLVGGELLHVDV